MEITNTDLANFMKCLFNDGKYGDLELLKKATLAEMFTLQFGGSKESPEFGLGFGIGKFGKNKFFWHNGII